MKIYSKSIRTGRRGGGRIPHFKLQMLTDIGNNKNEVVNTNCRQTNQLHSVKSNSRALSIYIIVYSEKLKFPQGCIDFKSKTKQIGQISSKRKTSEFYIKLYATVQAIFKTGNYRTKSIQKQQVMVCCPPPVQV